MPLPVKLLFVTVSTVTLFAADSFTIPQVMSSPFASAPLAAPSVPRVAWLENEQGKRNVYVAGAPDWKAKRLTNFQADDGQEIAELTWAPDSSYLLFTRGGDFENGGDNPNPALQTRPVEQEIWFASADGLVLKRLTQGHAAAVPPQGGLIVFLRGNQLFTMRPGGENITELAIQKGTLSDLRWSPDGASLAFVLTRARHSFIGVYKTADRTLQYLDPSTDHDSGPVWFSDSYRIAFLRVPTTSERLGPGPRREGEPWSIRVADLRTGASKEVFRAALGPGSVFHGLSSERQIFVCDGRVVFPWERSGWLHLYSVSVEAQSAPVELTPGEGEVEHVVLSGKTLFFSANFGELDTRHLWSVSVDGSEHALQLTRGESIDTLPAPLTASAGVVFLSSAYNETIHPALLANDGHVQQMASEIVPANFPAGSLVKPQTVVINAADGMPIHCQIFLPPDSTLGVRHPAIAFFHGGSRRQMLPGFHYMYYYSNAYALNQYLASQGYVVLSVNYRSGIGYGLKFREALHYGAEGGSEYNDVAGAGLYLKSRADVNPARVGLWGGSYGGYLTALGLARASDLFSAGVDFHGVHDWSSLRDTGGPPTGGDPRPLREYQEALRVAFDSSPMASVDTWKSPVLLIHGDDDRNVSFGQTVILAEALRERHVDFEELIFPNEIHDFLRYTHWVQAYEATVSFFARKLH